jgi:protein-S-isoprenylcysteine O-methyltransferase Ste14
VFVLARAVTWSALFIGLLLVFVPSRLLAASGLARPAGGPLGLLGAAIALGGGALALWCIATFAFVGRGTPAPFDPPRALVVRGPYAFVRNPMYVGAALALTGAAAVYCSPALLGYAALFAIGAHAFVVAYEEPMLSRSFGADYEAYRARVRRWLPRF